MKHLLTIILAILISLSAQIINENGTTIKSRFSPPEGFTRIEVDSLSFGHYLRSLNLKQFGSKVLYFNGEIKDKNDVYISVVDQEISPRNLQQCADAVMRLRGEYLYSRKRFEDIHFNFLSDGKPRFFTKYRVNDLSYRTFRKYMDYIFAFANTASLHKELIHVEIDSMKIGDVFIQKSSTYGHAVIVADMAVNKITGRKLFILAQSYMPAQETQILINPNDAQISPWYELKSGVIITPEWEFRSTDLRRFKE